MGYSEIIKRLSVSIDDMVLAVMLADIIEISTRRRSSNVRSY